MNISIIGAGNIGMTLAKKWSIAGHTLAFGVRNPADPKFDAARGLGKVSSTDEALTDAQVVLLSLPGSAVADFAGQHGPALSGKVIIDATNNVRSPQINNIAPLRAKAHGAHLVRAFSTLGWENFEQPVINEQVVDLFYCGDPAGQATCDQLISEVGLRPVYLGDLDALDLVDNLTRLWLRMVFTQNRSRHLAFKLLEE